MANRWVWAYGMIIAYIVAVTWQDLCKIDIRKGLGIIIAIAVYSLAALLMMNEINHNIIFSLITALLIVIVCMILINRQKLRQATLSKTNCLKV